MRKCLVLMLALFMVSAVTGTTFAAADQFADVPANHWAYGALKQLAKEGVVSGYGDGTFKGDRLMTRYEMAQIVANAINKEDKVNKETKVVIDKLAAEFANELNQLGVRVSKLETKSKYWIQGMDMRFRYHTDDPVPPGDHKLQGSDTSDWRSRITFQGNVDDDWTMTGRLSMNWSNRFGNTDVASAQGSTMYVDVFNVKGQNVLGLDKVEIGRDNFLPFGYGLIARSDTADGLGLNKSLSSDVSLMPGPVTLVPTPTPGPDLETVAKRTR